jgi:hypothetical protein
MSLGTLHNSDLVPGFRVHISKDCIEAIDGGTCPSNSFLSTSSCKGCPRAPPILLARSLQWCCRTLQSAKASKWVRFGWVGMLPVRSLPPVFSYLVNSGWFGRSLEDVSIFRPHTQVSAMHFSARRKRKNRLLRRRAGRPNSNISQLLLVI